MDDLSDKIPKIIHYCWFGGGLMPEKDRKCMESWKKYCPDYEIKRWDETNYNVQKNAYMYEAYQAKKWGFVPDYARLDIIYQNGGFYLDTDVELIKNLDELRDNHACMGFEEKDKVNPGLLIGAVKSSASIYDIMETIYGNRHFKREDGSLDTVASPRMNTEYLMKKGLKLDGSRQTVNGITIYPTEYFCPKDYHTGKIHITDKTISIHHFNASWHTARQKSWRKFEERLFKTFGKKKMERFTHSVFWRGLSAVYMKGPFGIIKKIVKGINHDKRKV